MSSATTTSSSAKGYAKLNPNAQYRIIGIKKKKNITKIKTFQKKFLDFDDFGIYFILYKKRISI